jgi:hypothetical protein
VRWVCGWSDDNRIPFLVDWDASASYSFGIWNRFYSGVGTTLSHGKLKHIQQAVQVLAFSHTMSDLHATFRTLTTLLGHLQQQSSAATSSTAVTTSSTAPATSSTAAATSSTAPATSSSSKYKLKPIVQVTGSRQQLQDGEREQLRCGTALATLLVRMHEVVAIASSADLSVREPEGSTFTATTPTFFATVNPRMVKSRSDTSDAQTFKGEGPCFIRPEPTGIDPRDPLPYVRETW